MKVSPKEIFREVEVISIEFGYQRLMKLVKGHVV